MSAPYMLTARDFIADAIERPRRARPDCFGGVIELPAAVFDEFCHSCRPGEIDIFPPQIHKRFAVRFMNVAIRRSEGGVPCWRDHDGSIEEL